MQVGSGFDPDPVRGIYNRVLIATHSESPGSRVGGLELSPLSTAGSLCALGRLFNLSGPQFLHL